MNYKLKKIFPIIIIILIVSIVLNIVLYRNLIGQKKKYEEKNKIKLKDKLKEKETIILSLQKEVSNLKNYINNNTSECDNEYSTLLEKQQNYKEISNDFISAYLNYSTNKLNDRREKLLKISTKELVDRIAPEVDKDEQKEDILSSDPSFTSNIKNSKIYITELDDVLNISEVLADVSYTSKGSDGKSESRIFIYLQLKEDDNGTIKVVDFMYYPIS